VSRSGCILLFIAGCQAAPTVGSRSKTPDRQWILVERPYDEVEPWIQNSGDAEIAAEETTLVFEPVETAGEDRFGLLLQASRCPHRLRLSGDVPDRRQVGEPVEVTLSIDCNPRDLHRVDVIPTRSGVHVLGFQGAVDRLPHRSGFIVRGSAKVSLKFTADSQGLGGIKAVLSEIGRE